MTGNGINCDFQKYGKPFDELPSIVKRNPKLLYEYVRTGEIPNLDLIQDLINDYKAKATQMIDSMQKNISYFEEDFNFDASKAELKLKNILDQHFDILIENGYFNFLISFEEECLNMPYAERPLSLKRIEKKVQRECNKHQQWFNKTQFEDYSQLLWSKIMIKMAKDTIKELEE